MKQTGAGTGEDGGRMERKEGEETMMSSSDMSVLCCPILRGAARRVVYFGTLWFGGRLLHVGRWGLLPLPLLLF